MENHILQIQKRDGTVIDFNQEKKVSYQKISWQPSICSSREIDPPPLLRFARNPLSLKRLALMPVISLHDRPPEEA